MPSYSSHGNVRQLAALMQAHGVTRCVLCPGSRNAPINSTLAAMPGMECRSVTDERSAGFAALGWAGRVHAPVAVCVTSGSALLNLHPAVAEAFYRRIPLLVLSADRPARAIGQQEGQTIPQPGALGGLVRCSVDLPEQDAAHANRLANEALLALHQHGGGPAHINIPLSEPLFGVDDAPLPTPRRIERIELAHMDYRQEGSLIPSIDILPRRLILLGQLPTPPCITQKLREEKGFAIIGEHLCNSAGLAQTRPDLLLGPTPDASWSPDLLITCGGCVISKRLAALFRAHPPKEHWHVGADGDIIDPFGCLTRVVEGDPLELWELLTAFAEDGDWDYMARWHRTLPPVPSFEYSGMALVGHVMGALPKFSVLHLGNSSAVRYAQLYPLKHTVQVECNRGVNGIEGSLSTALGYAMGDDRPNILIIGDLSFFYDMNALWMPGSRGNMRVLLLNNGTGGIFSTLPGIPAHESIHGHHGAQAAAWAESMGWRYMAIRCMDELFPAVDALCAERSEESPLLVEAFTDADTDAALLREFYKNH